jgi:hypothetical protein
MIILISTVLALSLVSGSAPSPDDSMPPITQSVTPVPRPFPLRSTVTLAVSGAFFVAGATFLGISVGQTKSAEGLENEPRDRLLFQATSNRVGGAMFLAAGLMTAGVAGLVFHFERSAPIAIALVPLSEGGLFSMGVVAW